jgi:hypothetical protein
MKPPSLPRGVGLLLVGSGIYWMLSGQLIASFSSLAPELLRQVPLGVALISIIGIVCLFAGFPSAYQDTRLLNKLFAESNGWLYTLPIILASADIYLTLIGLSYGRTEELNRFVALAASAGSSFIIPFAISYMALSEGLAVLMLGFGRRLYGTASRERYLPFALICGAASFGPFSNLLIISGTVNGVVSYAAGIFAAGTLSLSVYVILSSDRKSG